MAVPACSNLLQSIKSHPYLCLLIIGAAASQLAARKLLQGYAKTLEKEAQEDSGFPPRGSWPHGPGGCLCQWGPPLRVGIPLLLSPSCGTRGLFEYGVPSTHHTVGLPGIKGTGSSFLWGVEWTELSDLLSPEWSWGL